VAGAPPLPSAWFELADDRVRLIAGTPVVDWLADRLRSGARRFPADLTIEVGGPDGPLDLTPAEIAGLLDDTSLRCVTLLDRARDGLSLDELELLRQTTDLLAGLWLMAFHESGAGPFALRRELAWIRALEELSDACADIESSRITARPDGEFDLRWGVADLAVLRDELDRLGGLLPSDDPAISRLFPSAYGDDADRNAGWDVLMRGELIDRRRAAIERTVALFDRDRCTAEELTLLMQSANDVRLVLGTELDVDEDARPVALDAGTARQLAAYERLGHLVHVAVEALGHGL